MDLVGNRVLVDIIQVRGLSWVGAALNPPRVRETWGEEACEAGGRDGARGPEPRSRGHQVQEGAGPEPLQGPDPDVQPPGLRLSCRIRDVSLEADTRGLETPGECRLLGRPGRCGLRVLGGQPRRPLAAPRQPLPPSWTRQVDGQQRGGRSSKLPVHPSSRPAAPWDPTGDVLSAYPRPQTSVSQTPASRACPEGAGGQAPSGEGQVWSPGRHSHTINLPGWWCQRESGLGGPGRGTPRDFTEEGTQLGGWVLEGGEVVQREGGRRKHSREGPERHLPARTVPVPPDAESGWHPSGPVGGIRDGPSGQCARLPFLMESWRWACHVTAPTEPRLLWPPPP